MTRRRLQTLDESLRAALEQRRPGFKEAVLADIRMERRQRREPAPNSRAGMLFQALRLVCVTDSFGALLLYRLKTSCQRARVPVVPLLLHRLAISWGQLSIGDPVVMHPGVYFPHGQVVIDGLVEIHPNVQVRPFVTIGLREGEYTGPTIHRNVKIGTGARILGPITIGEGATVGANAVVVHDVPAGATVVGVPARVVG